MNSSGNWRDWDYISANFPDLKSEYKEINQSNLEN